MLTGTRLQELISVFPTLRVGVVGDFFLDKYLDFDPALAEVSLETGQAAHQVVAVRHSPGAAGNVVCNLVALCAGAVIPIGFTGDDGEGYELRHDLSALGCTLEHLVCHGARRTPMYLKPRNTRVSGIAGEAERYDVRNRAPLPTEVERDLLSTLCMLLPELDALVIADQVEENGCGVVTASMRQVLASLAMEFPRVICWADSRCRSRLFENVIIKPNQGEAVRAAFPESVAPVTDELVSAAGRALHQRTGLPVFLTRAEHGILVFDAGSCTDVPGVRIDGPVDPTGAGDSVTAGAVLTLASGGLPTEAALVANLLASITVQQLGVTGVAEPEQLPARLALWTQQQVR